MPKRKPTLAPSLPPPNPQAVDESYIAGSVWGEMEGRGREVRVLRRVYGSFKKQDSLMEDSAPALPALGRPAAFITQIFFLTLVPRLGSTSTALCVIKMLLCGCRGQGQRRKSAFALR